MGEIDWQAAGIDIGRVSGEHVKTRCPKCSDGRSSAHTRAEKCLYVNTSTGQYICYNCGAKGTAAQGGDYGTIPRARVFKRPQYTPTGKLSPTALAWLHSRGITQAVWERAGLESRRAYNHRAGKELGSIAFPYRRDGQVIGVKYRFNPKGFTAEADAEPILYGIDDIEQARPLVWVEGEMDKLACEVAGYRSCVSMPNGAPNEDAKSLTGYLAPFESAVPRFERIKWHILAVDDDGPGRRLRTELARRIGAERCRAILYPEDCKDCNDILVKHGTAELARLIDSAPAVPISGLFPMADDYQDARKIALEGLPQGYHPGSDALGKHYRIAPGLFTVVTGIPSMGKSEWLNWLMWRLSDLHGWSFAVYSPETFPRFRHELRLMQLEIGRDPELKSGDVTQDVWDAAWDSIAGRFYFVAPGESERMAFSIDDLIDLFRSAILRHGVNGIVIDPWTAIEHARAPGVREDEHIARTLTKLRGFARSHNAHLWIVAHPKLMEKVKDRAKEDKGEYKIPRAYDISGGSQWYNHADNIVCIHRDQGAPGAPTMVYVQKIRNEPSDGMKGGVSLHWERRSGRYYDAPESERWDG